MVKHKDILTLLYWRDETNDRRKANVIQRVIDKMMYKAKCLCDKDDISDNGYYEVNPQKIELSKLMITVRIKGLNLGWKIR